MITWQNGLCMNIFAFWENVYYGGTYTFFSSNIDLLSRNPENDLHSNS